MIVPAPTFAPNQRCLIRIVGHYEYRDFAQFGGEIRYLDACFRVERAHIVAIIEPRERLALIELNATIIQPTGRASFLVGYKGHRLRVHVQQIQESRP